MSLDFKTSSAASDDLTPQEIASVEAALNSLDTKQRNQWPDGFIGQWFLVLKLFKTMEVSFSRASNRETFQQRHRALLTSLMSVGDLIIAEKDSLDEKVCAAAECNVRYLRDKYEQWYVDVDPKALDAFRQKILAAA